MSLFELLAGDASDLRETIAALSRYIERLTPEALSDQHVCNLVHAALLQRGTASLLLKDDTAAQADFQHIIEGGSSDNMRLSARLLLGSVYAESGQDEQALSCWTTALEAFEQTRQTGRAKPSQEIAKLYLYRAMMSGRLLRYQEAISDCDRALEYAPHETEALAVRGIARAFLGELDLALADCLQAVERAPQVDHLSRLGEVYLLRKEYRQACEVLDRAAALDPTNERVALQLRRALGGMVLEIMQTEAPASQTSDSEASTRPLVSQRDAEESAS